MEQLEGKEEGKMRVWGVLGADVGNVFIIELVIEPEKLLVHRSLVGLVVYVDQSIFLKA